MFWFISAANAQDISVFSRLISEESIPSNDFLSGRKIEIETQLAWNNQIQQLGSLAQISVFPIEPLQLSIGIPIWAEQDFRAVDIMLHSKYIFWGDENRWNLAAGSGLIQTRNDGSILTPSLFLAANSSQDLFQSYWKLGGVANTENYGFHLMGMSGIQLSPLFLFGQFERMKFGKKTQNRIASGAQLQFEGWNIRTQISTPALLNPTISSLRYSLEVEVYPKTGDKFSDSDDDGIWNRSDICPEEAEDIDGFKDSDGCPDLDNDFDTIPDKQDLCPIDKEDFDGFQDDDGCPEIDNDLDGILDQLDRCPEEAETMNGFRDSDGCPERSAQSNYDGDSLPDHRDKCPYDAEDYDGFEDDDGCPEIDNDHDGILDPEDQKPMDADTTPAR